MIKPPDGSQRWPALIGLIIVLAILGSLIWRAEMGEEVTMGVKGVGKYPVVAHGTPR
jgi:hypothetical protein